VNPVPESIQLWSSPEAFGIQLLDELAEGELPRFLAVVVQRAQLLGVQAELSSHAQVTFG
jgi:hypothetical protein